VDFLMGSTMAKKPLYIQHEPGAYPKDIDWQMMTAEERGCYHSLIIFLACSDGYIPNEPESLCGLCNINIDKLKTFLKKYSHKFVIKDGKISHKRVNEELAKARKSIKQKSLAGKKGMQQRYNSVITPTPKTDITKERKAKGRKDKEREVKKYVSIRSPFPKGNCSSVASCELKFYDITIGLFKLKKQSDRTTIQNVARFLSTKYEFDDKIFSKAWNVANECMKGTKPIALFMSRIKDELQYRKVEL
jgi:uncharacterized protein YdaU (DUF1376 family)